MYGKQWEEYAASLTPEQRKDIYGALLTLKNYNGFAKEWEDTGLFSLQYYFKEDGLWACTHLK